MDAKKTQRMQDRCCVTSCTDSTKDEQTLKQHTSDYFIHQEFLVLIQKHCTIT